MANIEFANYGKKFEELCRDMKKDILRRKTLTESEANAELKKILLDKLNKELGGK